MSKPIGKETFVIFLMTSRTEFVVKCADDYDLDDHFDYHVPTIFEIML